MKLARAALGLLLLAGPVAHAQCVLNGADISNTTDPACADRMLTYTESTSGADLIALGYPVPRPVDSLTAVDGYRSYDSLLARQQDLALTEPNVRADLAGATLLGRDIWVYSLGDANNLTVDGLPEPAVMAVGGMHAREWQPPEAVSALLENLVGTANDNWLGSYLRDNLKVVLLPVLNVDGFLQTQAHPDQVSADPAQPREGRMRRRNLRNPNTNNAIDDTIATSGDNFWGVDLNRNNPEGWGRNGGSSGSVTSLLYRGPTASSEPEVQALQNAASFAPADRLRFYMDIHSFSQAYLAPSTGNARRDRYTAELAQLMRAVQGFKYGFAADAANGGIGLTADYFAYRFDIPTWTLEIEPRNGAQEYGGTASHGHSGFILPDAEVERMRSEIVASSLIGFYRQSGAPYVVAARIVDVETNEIRYSAEWQADNAGRTLTVSENRALLPGGNFQLWLAFSKPMRFRTETGNAGTYPGQLTGATSGTVVLELPRLASSNDVAADTATLNWLDQPDGQVAGYRRYVFDAATVDFSIPASLSVAGSEPAVLSLAFADMSDFRIDADPATPVDWRNGAWSGFEDVMGVAGDVGGMDCQLQPFVAMNDTATSPSIDVACRAAAPAVTPPPPAPPPTSSSSGGGNGLWLLFFLLAATVTRTW